MSALSGKLCSFARLKGVAQWEYTLYSHRGPPVLFPQSSGATDCSGEGKEHIWPACHREWATGQVSKRGETSRCGPGLGRATPYALPMTPAHLSQEHPRDPAKVWRRLWKGIFEWRPKAVCVSVQGTFPEGPIEGWFWKLILSPTCPKWSLLLGDVITYFSLNFRGELWNIPSFQEIVEKANQVLLLKGCIRAADILDKGLLKIILVFMCPCAP